MDDSTISSKEHMLEYGTSNMVTSDDSSVKYHKKKNRGKKRKTCCYVDYDQTTGEDIIQSAASLTWPGKVSSVQVESDTHVKHCTRDSVSYEDEDNFFSGAAKPPSAVGPPIIRGKLYNNQFSVTHASAGHTGTWMNATSSGLKKFPMFPIEHGMPRSCSSELLSCVDPTVAASEKKEIFKKQHTEPVNNAAKQQKPMTEKKRNRMKRKKHFKELQKKQDELAKQRANAVKPLKPCKYFQSGNCNKGKNCTFSHDCEIVRKPEVCKFYLVSTCTKGLACPYYHSDWPCKFFHVFEFCMNGDACKFSHAPLTDESRELLNKAMANGDASAAKNIGQEMSHDVAKENRLSNGNTPQTMNYGAHSMMQPMMASYHPDSTTSLCHPRQLTNSCPLPPNTAAVSMTLQQKVYRLNPIEFVKPVRRELPPYINVYDPRWSADPRVQPCVHPAAMAVSDHVSTNGTAGLAFYGSAGADSASSENSLVVQRPEESTAGGTENNTEDRTAVTAACDHVNTSGIAGLAFYTSAGADSASSENSSVIQQPGMFTAVSTANNTEDQTAVTAAGDHINTSETAGFASYSSAGADSASSENSSVVQQPGVVVGGAENNSEVSSTSTHLHANVATTCGSTTDSCRQVESSSVNDARNESSSVDSETLSDLQVAVSSAASTSAARHMFQHNVSWLSVARSSGVQKLSQAKNGTK